MSRNITKVLNTMIEERNILSDVIADVRHDLEKHTKLLEVYGEMINILHIVEKNSKKGRKK